MADDIFDGRRDLVELLGGLSRATSGGRACLVASGKIARGDTQPKVLFTLPPGVEGHFICVSSAAGSDASLTAVIDVGKPGTPTFYMNGMSVLGNAGLGLQIPTGARGLTPITSDDTDVNGRYTETGTASTTGGPWTVSLFYSRGGN